MIRNIVLEGPDAAGKSTLAKALHVATGWPIHPKEGKPDTFEATVKKCERYLKLDGYIIDRHPMVSQAIYGQVIRNDPLLPPALIKEFHSQFNLIIYCRCIEKGMSVHVVRDGEHAAHVDRVRDRYSQLVQLYDQFGLVSSHLIYNHYGNTDLICDMVKGALHIEC